MSALKEKVIFEYSRPGRGSRDQWPEEIDAPPQFPENLRRQSPPLLPEVGELEAVRHFTKLSQKNFSIDTHFYPLGSCTMKYNPRGANALASLPSFLAHHPLSQSENSQGFMACVYDLQEILQEVTGLKAAALSPMAGA